MNASPPARLHRLMPPPVVLVLMAALMALTARYPGWVLLYVGDVLLLLLGWAVFLGAPVNVLWIALFVGWMGRLQIPREEAALADHFGREYAAYCARVRRWL